MAEIKDFKKLEDDTQYSVSILKTVQWGRRWLRPHSDSVVLKGKVIKELGTDVVGNVHPLAD